MEEFPSWDCRFEPEPQGIVTVGAVFRLRCEGAHTSLDAANLKIAMAGQKDDYLLKILGVKSLKPESVELEVVTYRVGTHQSPALILTDGQNFIQLKGLSWQVGTVVEAQAGQEPTPYGPYGPWAMSWPWYYWAVLALTLLITGAVAWWETRLYFKRRRLRREVDKFRQSHSPYDEFHKLLRQMYRRFDFNDGAALLAFINEMEKQFRLYLWHEFYLPAHEMSIRKIAQGLKKIKTQKSAADDVFRFLTEIERTRQTRLTSRDAEQLGKIAADLTDRFNKFSGGRA